MNTRQVLRSFGNSYFSLLSPSEMKILHHVSHHLFPSINGTFTDCATFTKFCLYLYMMNAQINSVRKQLHCIIVTSEAMTAEKNFTSWLWLSWKKKKNSSEGETQPFPSHRQTQHHSSPLSADQPSESAHSQMRSLFFKVSLICAQSALTEEGGLRCNIHVKFLLLSGKSGCELILWVQS